MKKKKQNKKTPIKEKKEKTLEESLKDPVYVSYHTLLKLEEIKKSNEEIKRISYGIFEILNAFYQRMLAEETPEVKQKKKEEREGTFPSKK